MRFLSIRKYTETSVPPSQEQLAKLDKLIEDAMKARLILSVEGCMPSAAGARIRVSNGKLTVTDGPYTESKEVIGGFAILQANSKQEAIELLKQLLLVTGGDGECELLQVFEADQKTHARSAAKP